MDFKFCFEIGETIYGCDGESVFEYKVASRTYYEDSDGVKVEYRVYDPNNPSHWTDVHESSLYSEKEVAVQVLIEQENERHNKRISQLNAI
jgi:hypothetical protein